jgi:DegV family protein with EDD domain
MKIVTDSGFDLSPHQQEGMDLHTVPLKITLSEVTYLSGIDIQPEDFYKLLETTGDMPTTSTPSVGEFTTLYEKLAKEDPEILSIHISSGLSGTFNVALKASEEIKDAQITLIDTKSLSAEMGWQIEAAIRGIKAGWTKEKILALTQAVREKSEMIFTLPDLSYLIHGGRISHLKGLLASLLGIKPIIRVDKAAGKYADLSKHRTFSRAIDGLANYAATKFGEGSHLRVQIGHAGNPDAAEQLREKMEALFNCDWLPDCSISPVLGAHTGRGLVGMVFALAETFPAMP